MEIRDYLRCFALATGLLLCLPALAQNDAIVLTQNDFTYGSYIIDKPGVYRLGESISFNPNTREALNAAAAAGELDIPSPVDAYDASMPLFSQFMFGPGAAFSPGGPGDARYDPAAFGIGFFAAIVIAADDVELDLNGFTIEQSAEHALMQRFFAVIELADQPFLPAQGPASFGSEITPAHRVKIHNGTIGRSAHHGIHGNANTDVEISNVRFKDYEVAAVALNGVERLMIRHVVARNRKDVPVLGTFSSAMFIKTYVDDLVRSGSETSLNVNGQILSALDIQRDLRAAINNVHADLIVNARRANGRPVINRRTHPNEYGLFHNRHGVIDGNSYSFLTNHVGVAVDGFPTRPDGVTRKPARSISFVDVKVFDQQSFINEVPALAVDDVAAIDPVGAVFQINNRHPITGAPLTISTKNLSRARYTGNPVANAQALVAKAKLEGDVGSGRLDTSRMNITQEIIDWVEAKSGSQTLGEIDIDWVCNGDSMFHVNKGAIGFKIDSAEDVVMIDTRVNGISNKGAAGSTLCGDYSDSKSHPKATLTGYGGAFVRGYTFAGSSGVNVYNARVTRARAKSGAAIGIAVMTDSDNIRIHGSLIANARAGWGAKMLAESSNAGVDAHGLHVAPEASRVWARDTCIRGLRALGAAVPSVDVSGSATIRNLSTASQCGVGRAREILNLL